MDIEEVLRIADGLVFAKTGKHLEHLQKTVLTGTISGKTYPEIAQEEGFSESHVKNVGHELWQILSLALGKKVTKSNLKAIFKTVRSNNLNASISVVCNNNPTLKNINIFAGQEERSPATTQNYEPNPNQPQIDLGDAPEIFSFYGRKDEIATLKGWFGEERCRLVELLGMSGIGKTTIAIRLIEQIQSHFDYVIYRSLCFSPTLETTLTNLLQNFCQPAEIPPLLETQISQLLNHLRSDRCLIILDDVQMLFRSGELAGEYRPGFENYPLFFTRIAETHHQSSFLLISREKFREFSQLEKPPYPVRSFVLGSLGAGIKEILMEHELSDEDNWGTLINAYQGNPLWLDLTATMIKELCEGKVGEFLQYETLILCESVRSQLEQQFQRLTPAEQAIMIQLAQEDAPLTLHQIIKKCQFNPAELLNAMQSLGRRLMLETNDVGNITYFQLNPVWKQYVKERSQG
ncbi:MAG TPA: ATPase [Oscillatoriaceae cyanobacterium M33_DOE_052]|uniref:ATP-binding protein n=1 Tax=Planktothricoides sp. SpSt-374 TaxID=2282167 RepID=A0A7C3VPR5_9CYAN|nr:ATPase [Oscillatoriaceae cyanobacterium M33_DOE_052]